jgi:hypothetical protein
LPPFKQGGAHVAVDVRKFEFHVEIVWEIGALTFAVGDIHPTRCPGNPLSVQALQGRLVAAVGEFVALVAGYFTTCSVESVIFH